MLTGGQTIFKLMSSRQPIRPQPSPSDARRATKVPCNPNFEVYGAGYSGLINALGDNSNNVPGFVELIPDAGWDVVLESFDLGACQTRGAAQAS
jgi:hypothetical protein